MRRAIGLLGVLLACSRGTVPPGEPCTWSTPLTPGIPGSPGHLIPSELNPNGASELAVLMRRFVADLKLARAALDEGRPPPEMWSQHRRMRCAWPTDLQDRTQRFDGLAVTYLANLGAFQAGAREPRRAYEAVLDACQACHEDHCPGPIEVIDTLRLPRSSTVHRRENDQSGEK